MSSPWYMQQGMRVPGHVQPNPRREVAQEFFGEVIALGKYARERYLDECKKELRAFDQAELDELDANITLLEQELAKYK